VEAKCKASHHIEDGHTLFGLRYRWYPVGGGSLVSYFLPMIVFGLKVLLAIATGLVMTALL
jgi:hypothetical protein